MKEDYCLFGDLIVHDITYRTNKYEMICGPFVGVNNHTHNCMFGCGFLLNERIESFEWLFHTFLEAMGGLHPKTIMTDQSFAMSSAISSVFPNSKHRLCVWHISENSKKHIRDLRNQDGFLDLFDHVLKLCHTIPEFEYYWNRLVTEYSCMNNDWLKKLYNLREKWCPAFSKDFFSAGILSSQRSESTNHALSRKMQRKVHKVLSSSDSNEVARALCEEAFNKLKVDVEAHVGSIYFSDTDSPHNGEVQISNPKGSRNKGERNVRRKSVREKKTNQARGRKQAVHRSASTCSAELPSSMACSSLLDT
ncbi:unnamed protein product [Cuscuta campestris]|uniref:MULE transposase domain-containing protein n=1 Tax=Cuscuta campestris TaxID=132261 RepID=A0A484MES8_9ASTE|nr:unnamed protein product [Cuscuta campestris]